MPNPTAVPGFARTVTANVLPAYLFPSVTAYLSGTLRGDAELAAASYTTIAIPSALAALLVTVAFRALPAPLPGARPMRVLNAVVVSALGCLALAVAGCAVLVDNGWFDSGLLVDAAPSAVLGAGFTAAFSARARNRQQRALAQAGQPVPTA